MEKKMLLLKETVLYWKKLLKSELKLLLKKLLKLPLKLHLLPLKPHLLIKLKLLLLLNLDSNKSC